jgi:hypothetical protein
MARKDNIPNHVTGKKWFYKFVLADIKTKITNVVRARAKNDRKQMAQTNTRAQKREKHGELRRESGMQWQTGKWKGSGWDKREWRHGTGRRQ